MNGPVLPPEQRRLINNERVKLTASNLDRLSTACIVGGGLGPLLTYQNGQSVLTGVDLAFLVGLSRGSDYIYSRDIR